jgi:hypothetical protein
VATFDMAGGGIQFNGDTAAANALDDYEEGTWTPTIMSATECCERQASKQAGRYIKSWNIVTYSSQQTVVCI